MADHLSIAEIISRLQQGTIRIPGFQRRFVWPPDKAAQLMDSVYKKYPVGSILLWRTSSQLKVENRLGNFRLPQPERDWPIDYVLDGQQRITSIFTTFQHALKPEDSDPEAWLPIYYDFEGEAEAQYSRFVALDAQSYDPQRYFPLSSFFDPVEFSRMTRSLKDERNVEIVNVQQRFLTLLIPVQTFETEDRTSVAIVFERVNRMGIPLDTYQLLTAWTWSDDFNLQTRFDALAEEFADFGFGDLGEDSDLMMRCCAAALQHEPSPASLVDMRGAEVRERFDEVETAVRRSIDFLRTNLHVRHVKFLPYASQLIPLTAFFSINGNADITPFQRDQLMRWFWRSCFSHRYSGNPTGNIKRDIDEAVALRRGEPSQLATINVNIDEEFFLRNAFSMRTVASKALVLMIASGNPRSLLSGELIHLDDVLSEPNRREYHHCFPRAMLKRENRADSEINALANLTLLSRAENRRIGALPPSEYRKMMPTVVEPILESSLLPPSIFLDDYDPFVRHRAALLLARADELAGITRLNLEKVSTASSAAQS